MLDRWRKRSIGQAGNFNLPLSFDRRGKKIDSQKNIQPSVACLAYTSRPGETSNTAPRKMAGYGPSPNFRCSRYRQIIYIEVDLFLQISIRMQLFTAFDNPSCSLGNVLT